MFELVVVLLLLLLYERVPYSCRPRRGKRQRNRIRAIAGDGLRNILVGFPSSWLFQVGNCCTFAFVFVCYALCQMAIFFITFHCFLYLRSKMVCFSRNSWQYSVACTSWVCLLHCGHARSRRRASARRGEAPLYFLLFGNLSLNRRCTCRLWWDW